MTKFVIVAALLTSSSVWAADILSPTKAPFAPATAPLWQGFYIGAQVGYGSDPSALTPGALPPGFSQIFTGTLAGMPQGVTAGGRIGYDWQVGGVVWGLESDINWADFKRDGNEILFGGAGGVRWAENTNWWGSTNLRFGVPFLTNQALIYALGGTAYGNRTVDASGFVGPFSTQGSFGGSSVGWDAGGGLAAKISPASEVFIEGRWVDLGSVSGQLSPMTPGVLYVAPASQKFDFAIGQVGYAYHFALASSP
jgi:outer membrane immunogenic protein